MGRPVSSIKKSLDIEIRKRWDAEHRATEANQRADALAETLTHTRRLLDEYVDLANRAVDKAARSVEQAEPMPVPDNASWFTTSPAATIRAESIVAAFHDGDYARIAQALAVDQDPEAREDTGGPLALLVAMTVIADRLADGLANAWEKPYADVVHLAASIVSTAAINHTEENS